MSDLSGRLDIALRRDGDWLAVSIRSSRPVTAAQVFAGKPVLAVARQLPSLFSLCATAQAQACASACEQALGLTASAAIVQRRASLLRAETVKEHLWRLLLDWPQALGAAPAQAPMATAMRAYLGLRGVLTGDADPFAPGADLSQVAVGSASDQAQQHLQVLTQVAAKHVFGRSPARWLREVRDRDAFAAWTAAAGTVAASLVERIARDDLADLGCNPGRNLGRNAVEPLPASAMPDLAAALSGADADGFVAVPSWQGRPCETTPFARCRDRALIVDLVAQYGNGLLPRLAALLLELADALVALDDPPELTPRPAPVAGAGAGIGFGTADAARGLLVHRVEVVEGRVTRYHILAPTEWNFHPAGVVVSGLASSDLGRLSDDAELQRRVALYVTAVDPCVAYALSVC